MRNLWERGCAVEMSPWKRAWFQLWDTNPNILGESARIYMEDRTARFVIIRCKLIQVKV